MTRRIVKDHTERYVRDQFKLVGWVAKNAERRRSYFAACDNARAMLSEVTGPGEPSDDGMVTALMAAVQGDDTFTDYVADRDESAFLAESENWDTLFRAAAGQIYYEYLVACEKNEWPGKSS